jgi:putative oxidoreductase
MLGAMFIRSGFDAMRHPERLADAAKPVTDRVAPVIEAINPSLPTDAKTLVRVNGAAHVLGGLMLATDRAPRAGAALLAGTLVPTTLAGHRFWEYTDPQQRVHQRIQFFKNVSMLGGLVIAALDNEGRPGLAWRAGHLAEHAEQSARRAARATSRGTRKATRGTRRVARTTARETRLALLAAKAGRLLPG